MKNERIIAVAEDGQYRLIESGRSAATPWMTRADLHDWVWTQPLSHVTDMLGLETSIGWLCWIYDVQRPPAGYFNRRRAGRQPERLPLSADRDPEEPVPIVDFKTENTGLNIARVRLPLSPSARLGPPAGHNRIYPRTADIPLLAAPALGASGQSVRLTREPLAGPPVPMTLGLLHEIFRRFPGHEFSAACQLYGLSEDEFENLALRNEVGTLTPRAEARWRIGPLGSLHGTSKRKRLSRTEKRQIIDLGPEIRAEIAANVEQGYVEDALKLQLAERNREETARKTAEYHARRKTHVEAAKRSLPQVVLRALEGEGIFNAAEAEGIAAELIQTVSKAVKSLEDQDLGSWRSTLLGCLRRKVEPGPRDLILLFDHIAPAEMDRLGWREAQSPRYRSTDAPLANRIGLAEWLLTAGEALDAKDAVETALAECRAAMMSHSGDQGDRDHACWPMSR